MPRSVLQGVVGVAIIQTVLIAIGLFVAGIPGAPIWSVIILFLAIAQLPPLIVLAPIMAYAFSTMDTTWAVVFTVYQLVAGASDSFLKPLMMGRGLDIPMPVILIGAIGGMVMSGIIGLFAGAVANWIVVAPRLRAQTESLGNALTIPEFLANRFPDKAVALRVVSAIVIVAFFTVYTAAGLVGGGKTDAEADRILENATPADLFKFYQIAQAALGVAFMPDAFDEAEIKKKDMTLDDEAVVLMSEKSSQMAS